jgi:hypothetical protein
MPRQLKSYTHRKFSKAKAQTRHKMSSSAASSSTQTVQNGRLPPAVVNIYDSNEHIPEVLHSLYTENYSNRCIYSMTIFPAFHPFFPFIAQNTFLIDFFVTIGNTFNELYRILNGRDALDFTTGCDRITLDNAVAEVEAYPIIRPHLAHLINSLMENTCTFETFYKHMSAIISIHPSIHSSAVFMLFNKMKFMFNNPETPSRVRISIRSTNCEVKVSSYGGSLKSISGSVGFRSDYITTISDEIMQELGLSLDQFKRFFLNKSFNLEGYDGTTMSYAVSLDLDTISELVALVQSTPKDSEITNVYLVTY